MAGVVKAFIPGRSRLAVSCRVQQRECEGAHLDGVLEVQTEHRGCRLSVSGFPT